MKKISCNLRPLSRLLFIFALLSANISALADSYCDFTENNIHYIFIEGKTDEVAVSYREYESGKYGGYYSNYTGSVTVPATVTYNSVTYKVTAVRSGAFAECYNLTSVNLPTTITSIGNNAFFDCNQLRSVNIPQTVTTIGQGAFNGCVSLYSISIPKNIKSIEPSTFASCQSLSSITIPNNVSSIGYHAFYQCSNLRSIQIPDGVIEVGDDAFYGTSWLSNLPSGIAYVGKVAYKYVGTMSESTNVTLMEGTVAIAKAAFSGCSGLESINIPESVTTIGASAFTSCTSLKAITIPKNISSMGGGTSSSAFYGCSALKDVTILCPNVGYMWFRDVDAIERVVLGNDVKTIGQCAFYFCKGITSITIPESVTNIYSQAFSMCTSLATVTIANSQASIAYDAFSGTPWMDNQPDGMIYLGQVAYKYKGEMPERTNVVIKDGTVKIADHAFYSCSNLASVSIPESVKIIGSSAFYGCRSLESIILPDGIDRIGDNAFQYCRGLLSVSVPGSTTSIGSSVFSNCDNLSSAILSEGITDSGVSMFSNCKNLSSVIIPASLENIGNSTFYGCSSLSSITLPEGVKTIGNSAFQDCIDLSSVSIPASIISLGSSCFQNCTSLTDVLIPKGIKIIGSDSFRGCTSLTTITIPSSVNSIGSAAFADCSIKTVIVKAKDPISILPSVFSYYSNYVYYSYAQLATLYVPDGCKSIYEAAEVWKDFKEIVEIEPDSNEDTDNVIYISNAEGLVGQQMELSVMMNNTDDITGVQFDLYLPDGIQLCKDEYGDYLIELSRTTSRRHSIASQVMSDGALRVVISSTQNATFSGNSGTLLTFALFPNSTLDAGDYDVMIKNIILTDSDAKRYVSPDDKGIITLLTYRLGDVNNDGYIDVADLAGVVRFILENANESLIFKAADMDDNGVVEINDYAALVNVILAQDTPMNAPLHRTNTIKNAIICIPNLYLNNYGEGDLLVHLGNNDAHYTGLQIDLHLPDGIELIDESAEAADIHHGAWVQKRTDGTFRVVCASIMNEDFREGDVLHLKVKTGGVVKSGLESDACNVVLTDQNAVRHEASSVRFVINNTDDVTGVNAIHNGELTKNNIIYDISGRRITNGDLSKGIYIANGKKSIIK